MAEKVIVGMSGGVDSAVTAYLLQQQGYDVIGCSILMHDYSDFEDAKKVADSLGIPFIVSDARELFKQKVEDYFFKTYKDGMTPNPCVECNRFVKFESLFAALLKENADFVATGHYARVIDGKLYVAKDLAKDQSYFLYNVPREYFKKILFPLGEYIKSEVKKISEKFSDFLSKKEESQDICFLRTDYKKCLNATPGKIIDENGVFLAVHEGIFNYTIGQRRGLRIAHSEPLFVKKIDPLKNEVVVAPRNGVLARSFEISELNILDDSLFLNADSPWRWKIENVGLKIRYGSPYKKGTVYLAEDFSSGLVELYSDELGIAPGQSAVAYSGNQVILGGKIQEVFYH